MKHAIAPHWLNFIDGAWVDGERALTVDNPATAEPVATIALAGIEDAERVLDAARHCADSGWLSACRPAQRVQWLLRIAAEIRTLTDEGAWVLCQENGKALRDARDEFVEAARYFEYYAGIADKVEGISVPLGNGYVDFTSYEPMGVSVQIVPWNFPVSICARSLAPALAAGNAVVVKSPELSPLGLCVLFRAIERAGLPRGAANLLCGLGSEVGAHLVSSPKTDQIVFTGSVPTGQAILAAAAQWATPSVMELGGKSAAVVFPDADREQLLASVKSGIFFNAGQVCSAMSRLLVHRDIHDEIVAAVAEMAGALVSGAGEDDPDHTPLISHGQLERVQAMCNEAIAEGAEAIIGGDRQGDRTGHFMQPTVFAGVRPQMKIAKEEVFGPVLAVIPFDTEEEAIALANATDYGLATTVWTQDLGKAHRMASAIEVGLCWINSWFLRDLRTAFGGSKASGIGREGGVHSLEFYTELRNVMVKL